MVVMAHTVNVPRHFPGTPEEVATNWATHHFGYEDRCFSCDCRPWGIVSEWPCGADVPRVVYVDGVEVANVA